MRPSQNYKTTMKFRFFDTIRGKIITGFFVLVILFSISAVFNYIIIQKSESIISDLYDGKDPSLSSLNEFKLLVTHSRELTTNWVYLIKDEEDKVELRKINKEGYPILKKKLEKLAQDWEQESRASLDSTFAKYEEIQAMQLEIMTSLSEFESYDDPQIKFEAEENLDFHILPLSKSLVADLETLIDKKVLEKNTAREELLTNNNYITISIIISGLVIMAISIITSLLTANRITVPVKEIQVTVEKLSKGQLAENLNYTLKDEIGATMESVNHLVSGLKATSKFATEIGNGNYDMDYHALSEEDELGNSLLAMRDNLKMVAEEDKFRNWANEGYAKFGELLRSSTDSFEELGPKLISELVKYMNSNQGAFFILNEENLDDRHLELIGCYAWKKRKYLKKRVNYGEGIAGQVWREKDIVFMTDVPEEFVQITSGLGKSNPRSILVVPLKFNQEIYGIIELASFKVFSKHDIEFIERLSESIASTISSISVNKRTKTLLEESQVQSEELRMKDEEMRQNMEEMQATQEQVQRKEREYMAKIEKLEKNVGKPSDESVKS
ncbi:MAG: GAF domain-containing protein [Flammeovirgaceae bacterium]|nr:GAF domain-containing protein [Flammeovirgaceae bacterium]